jgi:hypothetical protein
MKDAPDTPTLNALLSALADGQITAEQHAQLEAMLEADPAAQRLYAQFMHTHAALVWELAPPLGARRGVQRPRRAASRYWIRSWVRVGAAAAIVLMVAGIAAVMVTQSSRDLRTGFDAAPIAALIDAQDAVWDGPAAGLKPGSRIAPSVLHLKSGLASIEFDSGAQVTLEGPAVFALNSPMRGMIRAGSLTAHVPTRAHHFTIAAPGLAVVDLGTAFGIRVDSAGRSEIHVFQGQVEVQTGDAATPGQTRLLTVGNTVRAHSDGKTTTLTDVDMASVSPSAKPAFAQTVPVVDGLSLWLDASRGVERQVGGRAMSWSEPSVGSRPSRLLVPPDMAQAPLITEHGTGGLPALRFRGGQALPLPPASELGLHNGDYEMFFVARSEGPGIQFLIAGDGDAGMENYELHINSASGARFIPSHGAAGNRFADDGKVGQFSGQPHVFAARVAKEIGTVSVDGLDSPDIVSHARNPVDVPLVIGRRGSGDLGLNGEISEVLIYRRALTAEERTQVGRYLAAKYKLATQY